MKSVRWVLSGLSIWVLLAGCGSWELPCPGGPGAVLVPTPAGALVTTASDPYEIGPLAVATYTLDRCEQDAPRPISIHAPVASGTYPIILFQHGFLADARWYSEMLRQVASHGFIVVAAQMYPANGLPIGQPTVDEEVDRIEAVLAWLPGRLEGLTGTVPDYDRLGLAGHSRGGKVIWTLLNRRPSLARAVAGVDPVDGRLDGTSRVTDAPFAFAGPSLIIGAALAGTPGALGGMSCAPPGSNYEQFFAAAGSPAWRVVAQQAGHLDMLNADLADCGIICGVCTRGPDPAATRQLCAGLLTVFFQATLSDQGERAALLEDASLMPTSVSTSKK